MRNVVKASTATQPSTHGFDVDMEFLTKSNVGHLRPPDLGTLDWEHGNSEQRPKSWAHWTTQPCMKSHRTSVRRVIEGLRSSERHRSVRRVPYKRFKAKKKLSDLIEKQQGIWMLWVRLHTERRKVQRVHGARKGAPDSSGNEVSSKMPQGGFIKTLSDN